MTQEIISYTKKNEDGSEYNGQVTMNFPETLEEMSSMWGEEVAFQKAKAQIVIDARRFCYAADSPEQAQEMVSAWVPGVSRTRTTSGVSKKALLELLKGMSKEDIAAFVAKAQTSTV